MKWTTLRTIALAAVCFGAGCLVSKFDNAAATKVESVTRSYALSNTAVGKATIELTKSLGDAAPKFVVDEEKNEFTANALPELHARLQSLIAKLDARPPMVKIACELARTDSKGTRTVISRPQVITVNANEAMFSVGQEDGEIIEVKLVPNIVLSEAQ